MNKKPFKNLFIYEIENFQFKKIINLSYEFNFKDCWKKDFPPKTLFILSLVRIYFGNKFISDKNSTRRIHY